MDRPNSTDGFTQIRFRTPSSILGHSLAAQSIPSMTESFSAVQMSDTSSFGFPLDTHGDKVSHRFRVESFEHKKTLRIREPIIICAEDYIPKKQSRSKELSACADPFSPRAITPSSECSSRGSMPAAYLRTPPKLSLRHSSPSMFPFYDQRVSIEAQSLHLNQGETNGDFNQTLYDPYVSPPPSLAPPPHGPSQPQINPYSQDTNTSGGASYYNNSSYAQPIQYHLYTSLGPHREALLPYQRAVHDFFIPDSLREDLQRKSAATLQTLPSVFPQITLYKIIPMIGRESTDPFQTPHFLPRLNISTHLYRSILLIKKTPHFLDTPVGFTRLCRARMETLMLFGDSKVRLFP